MSDINLKRGLVIGALLAGTALTGFVAEASHFRGAAMVPTVSSTGLLTVQSTSFWRKDFVEQLFPSVSGLGGMTQIGAATVDQSDSRFAVVTQTHQIQLPGAGTYQISSSSCCRVSGIANALEDSFTMNSAIVWDGNTAHAPILFDFSAIQPEVIRGVNYSDNLGATSGSGLTLTYDQVLNVSITSQPPGFVIDPATGQLTIPGANTATYVDNPNNLGADYAFSGNIHASDGSFVEFDWLFDAVDSSSNLAPDVDDAVVNALLGTTVNHTVTGSDPNGDSLTWDLLSFFGPGANLNPTFDPVTQLLTWDTTGSTPGTYIANVRASDGSLSDVGTITINVTERQTPPPTGIFEPMTLLTFGTGLVGLAAASRRRRRQD